MGIKDRRLQEQTIASVHYFEAMNKEVENIVLKSTEDKFKKKELSEPTTTYHLHKNLLKMRALYSRSQESQTLPDIINQTSQLELGKSPANKINFSQNYMVL